MAAMLLQADAFNSH